MAWRLWARLLGSGAYDSSRVPAHASMRTISPPNPPPPTPHPGLEQRGLLLKAGEKRGQPACADQACTAAEAKRAAPRSGNDGSTQSGLRCRGSSKQHKASRTKVQNLQSWHPGNDIWKILQVVVAEAQRLEVGQRAQRGAAGQGRHRSSRRAGLSILSFLLVCGATHGHRVVRPQAGRQARLCTWRGAVSRPWGR